MILVGIGVDVAHRNGLHLLLFQIIDGFRDVLFAQRRDHLALVADSLCHLPPEIPRDERRRLFKHEIEQIRAVAPGEL